tara:strand:- start:38 stop:874 length:837 start_codon:yes stop_codon:yes gene_type:complete
MQNNYITFCNNVRATSDWKRTLSHTPVPKQGKILGAMWRHYQQQQTYRASALIAAKFGVDLPVEAGDHFSDSKALKNAGMLNKRARDHSKSESYKAFIKEKKDDERMRRKGFVDWKSNWLDETGANALELNKAAAKEAVRILGLSYVTVVLRGPPRNKNFKSNLTKLYPLMDELVHKVMIIRQNEHSTLDADPTVKKGEIIRIFFDLHPMSGVAPSQMTIAERMKLKAAIVSIFRSNDLDIDSSRIYINFASQKTLANLQVQFGDTDAEHRRLIAHYK